MRTRRTRSAFLAALLCSAGPLAAQEINLIAGQTIKIMPDGSEVVMWGFAEDGNANGLLDGDETITVPGPLIDVPSEDAGGLTIRLHNQLAVPVSIVIPGVTAALNPVFQPDAQGRQRVHSFTHETPPGGVGVYTWPDIAPGTHVYHSGTHPQVQVQMGLYGGVKRDAAPGLAYPGVGYTAEAVILFSEIDSALHAAVAGGQYGPGKAVTSTVGYRPDYFLVNGDPYQPGSSLPIAAGAADRPTLLRLINLGLTTRVALLQGAHLRVVAEDGFAYRYPASQYAIDLDAAKSKDALFTPPAAGLYPLYDRRLAEGMVAMLEVAAAPPGPEAVDDSYAMDEDSGLTVLPPGVLANDGPAGTTLTAVLVDPPAVGTLALQADGGFAYTPPADFNGVALFTYRASDGTTESLPATVTLTVNPLNDAPVASADAYSLPAGETLIVGAAAGVLANDSDVDGDTLTASLLTAPVNGTLVLNGDGSFTYTPNAGFAGSDSFVYAAADGTTQSEATVTLTVTAVPTNTPPVANDDNAETYYGRTVIIDVVSNDTDADGTVDPTTVAVTTQPLEGTVVNNGDGTLSYTPRRGYLGTDALGYTVRDDQGAVSNEATVRINVTRTR